MLFVAAIGCGGNSTGANGPQDKPQVAQAEKADVANGAGEEQDESTADLAEHHRHHHHGGFAMFIAMSLDSLGVSDDQRAAIVKIQTDMHAEMQPAHDAEKALLLVLADGVAAGQVDQAKVDAAIAQAAAASATVHDAVAASLDTLHSTLTAPQRQALVDKVEAHLEVWHHANSPDEAAAKDAHGGHLGAIAKHLALSPDQVEKIRASFTSSAGSMPKFDRAEADVHLKAFADAFASDHFDAKALQTGGPLNAHMAAWGLTRMAHIYEAAAPVLTPEQRTKAAESLRKHAHYKRTESEG